MVAQDIVEDYVVAAVQATVRGEMEPFNLRSVRVTAAEDHDGDPILFIDADYESGGRPIEPEVVAGLVTKLRNRLWDLGETRFPHIRHHFPEPPSLAGHS